MQPKKKKYDITLLTALLFLVAFGLIILYSTSAYNGEVKFHDANIYDVLEMTVNQAVEFFTKHGQKKIVKKLAPLQDVGLGYIKLGQSPFQVVKTSV